MIICLPYLMSIFITPCLLFWPEDCSISSSRFLPNDIYLLYDTFLDLTMQGTEDTKISKYRKNLLTLMWRKKSWRLTCLPMSADLLWKPDL